MKRYAISALFPIILTLYGCAADTLPPPVYYPVTTPVVTTNLADSVILPQVFQVDSKVSTLRVAISNFVLSHTEENLQAARAAWLDAHSFWAKGEAFLFGPAVGKKLHSKIDSFPVSTADIETILTTYPTIGPSDVLSFDGTLKGFHTLEYLLFGSSGNKKASDFTDKQYQYLSAVIADMDLLTQNVRYAWDPSLGNYIGQVKNPGNGGTYATDTDVLRDMLNSMIAVCNDLAQRKIGAPLVRGDASKEESHFSSNSKTDYKDNVLGVLNMYQGGTEPSLYGISGLVQQTGRYDIDAQVSAEITAAMAKIDALYPSFAGALVSNPASVNDAKDAVTALASTLETVVKPLLLP
jgi:predicted lipoprotein